MDWRGREAEGQREAHLLQEVFPELPGRALCRFPARPLSNYNSGERTLVGEDEVRAGARAMGTERESGKYLLHQEAFLLSLMQKNNCFNPFLSATVSIFYFIHSLILSFNVLS